MKKILLCGGGSGGHITPILAIAHELKRQNPDCVIIYVGEHGGKFAHLVKNQTSIDTVSTIFAGKFRRYHNEPWLKRILDVKTNLLNIRDLFFVVIGFFQSLFLLQKIQPDIVFLKGGYVGLPIGLAASLSKISYITHDSDTIPSLTNKLVGKWAKYNTTGIEQGEYPYDKKKLKFVGIPVAAEFTRMTEKKVNQYKKDIGIKKGRELLLIIGGSLGAAKLNHVMRKVVPELLSKRPELEVIHQVGKGKLKTYKDYSNSRLKVFEFIPDLYRFTGAADVVITRGGANSIAELAVQGKAIVIVPNPFLTAGHQVKNAESLGKQAAAEVLNEEEIGKSPETAFNLLLDLLSNNDRRKKLSSALQDIGEGDAAKSIAKLLLSI